MTPALRDDFGAQGLRVLARQSKHAGQARRLLALAAIYEGGRRSDAARIGGVTLQIVRDWVVMSNARGPAGLIDGTGPGQPSLLSDAQRAALAVGARQVEHRIDNAAQFDHLRIARLLAGCDEWPQGQPFFVCQVGWIWMSMHPCEIARIS